MKIKCVKAECPNCKTVGSIQLFMNRNGEVRYARTRHYSHIDKDSKKPQFTYCKIENLEALEELLRKLGYSLPTANGQVVTMGQATQEPSIETSNSIQNTQAFSKNIKNAGPLGFEPRTFSLEG
jgi:hypothetical protein